MKGVAAMRGRQRVMKVLPHMEMRWEVFGGLNVVGGALEAKYQILC